MSEPKLTCHYCGAECGIARWEGKFCTRCKRHGCHAEGPLCDTPDLVRLTHARVMPVPVWASEPPNGWAIEEYKPPGGKAFIDLLSPQASRERHRHYRYSALVMPAEPAEGGAK